MGSLAEMACGSWKSKVSIEMVAEAGVRFNYLRVMEESVVWEEMRSKEKGRVVLVTQSSSGKMKDLFPKKWSAHTRINEYGGCSYCVAKKNIFFINDSDQCVYWLDEKKKIHSLTKKAHVRYGDLCFDDKRNRLICVEEDLGRGDVHSLVSIQLDGTKEILTSGHDFYASPQINLEGTELVYLSWENPFMPWDAASLFSCTIKEDGSLGKEQKVAGGEGASVFQPSFGPDGDLFFVCEKSGFWNLYRRSKEKNIISLSPMEAEFAVPQWVGGLSTYTFVSEEEGYQILCTYIKKGKGHLALVDPKTSLLREMKTPFTYFSSLTASQQKAFFIAGSGKEVASIIRFDWKNQSYKIVKRSKELSLDPREISLPEEIEFPTSQNETAYAFYYPPTNATQKPLRGEKPPLMVLAHGGPTAQSFPILSLAIQYWTNRGFALVDVNYRGSTGYGRQYREKLLGHMLYNVEDCIAAAHYLCEKGKADDQRLIVKGGSAGGYTALAALAFYRTFQIGVSYYGVSNLESLARDTHKFEKHYLDRLVGPYAEKRDLYVSLSPFYSVHHIAGAVLFFQGSEDKIVPPDQSQKMYEALKKRGVVTSYLLFAHEQHGFCRSSTLKDCLAAEEYFYARIFGFSLAEKRKKISIDNLPKSSTWSSE